MRNFMDWSECEKNFIKEVEVDPDKVNSLIETAKSRVEFIQATKVNKKNVSFVVEGYYEVIKELLVALLLSKGLKSKNHQCLITYFYLNYKKHESEAHLIYQLCYLRNRLDYYGDLIEMGFYEKNKQEF